MSFVAVHMDFLKHGKFDIVGLFSPSLYFEVWGRFLIAKLVAREGENVEASASILLMELDHLFVVSVSVSEGRDIDDHNTFLTSCWHTEREVSNSINISCTEGPQWFAWRFIETLLLPLFLFQLLQVWFCSTLFLAYFFEQFFLCFLLFLVFFVVCLFWHF